MSHNPGLFDGRSAFEGFLRAECWRRRRRLGVGTF